LTFVPYDFFTVPGFRRLGHSGSIATYKSQVWYYPDEGFGVFIATNGPPIGTTTRALTLMLHYISATLLGQRKWLNASTACTFPSPWLPEDLQEPGEGDIITNGPPPLPNDTFANLHSYAGVYSHPGFGNIIISVPDPDDLSMRTARPVTKLRMRMGRAYDAFLYFKSSSNTFYTNFTGIFWYSHVRIPLKFHYNSDKRVMDRLYMPMHFPYDTVEPACFVRGEDPKKYFNHIHEHYYCSASYNSFMKYLLLVVIVMHFVSV
jgi:hypothetical protein